MIAIKSAATIAANDNDAYRFYVYAWLYPDGRPFYIGKGNGRRDAQPKKNKIFTSIVAKIISQGNEPKIVRWQDGLREDDAFTLEKAYIKLFGRRNIRTGVLANLTDGGDGVSGLVFSEESLSKLSSSLREYCKDKSVRDMKSAANKRRYTRPGERERSSLAIRLAAPGSGNKTGYKGVSFFVSMGMWRATLNAEGRQRHIGLFDSPESAARAYDHAAVAVWGRDGCYLNLPNDPISAENGDVVLSVLAPSQTFIERQSVAKRKAPAHADCASGLKGVISKNNKWQARIRVDGKLIHIGTFATPEAAARAYDSAAVAAWGHGNCYLNYPTT